MALPLVCPKSFSLKPFSLKPLWVSLSLVGLAYPLIGCQTAPYQANSSYQNTKPLTGAELLQNALLHRFDTSFDYEKVTTYRAMPLLASNDVEVNDQSVIKTLLENHQSKKAKKIDDSLADNDATAETTDAEKHASHNSTNNPAGYTTTTTTTLKSDDDDTQSNDTNSNCDISSAENAADAARIAADCPYSTPKKHKPTQAQINPDIAKAVSDAQDNALQEKYLEKDAQLATKNAADAAKDAKDFQKTYGRARNSLEAAVLAVATAKAAENIKALSGNSETDTTTPQKDAANTGNFYTEGVQKLIDGIKKTNTTPAKTAHSESEDNDSIGKEKKDKDEAFNQIINQLKLTPQQVQVMDTAYFTPRTISYKGSYHQPSAQFSMVYEDSLHTAFMDKYKRVPVLMDFKNMAITLEPDVAYGFMALFATDMSPENSEKLNQLVGKSVRFTLPRQLQQKIPLPMMKDSLLNAIGKAYGDLDSEKFSEVVMDDYGRNLHASRVVKLNLTSKDMGVLMGRSMKHWADNLNQIGKTHPEFIQNYPEFNKTLELLNTLNQHYRADDLARLAQLTETVLPIGYGGYNYYYFDADNQLIGYRKKADYSSSLLNARLVAITDGKISYTQNTDNPTPVYNYYQPAPADIIDGNALVTEMVQNSKQKKLARNARYAYNARNAYPDPDVTQDKADDSERVGKAYGTAYDTPKHSKHKVKVKHHRMKQVNDF